MKELIIQAKEDIRAGKDLATLRAHLVGIINKLEGTLIPEQMEETKKISEDVYAQHMLSERSILDNYISMRDWNDKPTDKPNKPQLQIVNFRDPGSLVNYVNTTSNLEVVNISEDSGDVRLYYRIIQ